MPPKSSTRWRVHELTTSTRSAPPHSR
jgi:hypothetical protein